MHQVTADDRPPIVHCTVDKGGTTVSFYCRACKDRHEHGHESAWFEAPGYEIGHRASHCWNDRSPYRYGGYRLVLASPNAK